MSLPNHRSGHESAQKTGASMHETTREIIPGIKRAQAREIELLAPARNADFGMAAIEHGADAVYIGGPSFGARADAGNALPDIERLARHAPVS